jgi:hypothetical protein
MYTFIMGNVKKGFLLLILILAGSGIVFAQEGTQDSVAPAKEKKPLAKPAFESGYFIADRTVTTYPAKTLEFVIQHDFGTIQTHWEDLYGIWGASNIRLGVNYNITKNLQIGFGTTKLKVMQDFSIKYAVLHQRVGGCPVSVSLYGNMAIATNSPDKANYEAGGGDYTFVDRLSYYAEAMVARKFCKEFSLQLSIGWVHYNLVDSATMTDSHVGSLIHDNLNIAGIGRIKISPQSSIILSYSQPVLTWLNSAPWPNFGLGWEISTSTHCFQIFLSSANGLVPQETVMYNPNNPYNGAILLGFNITRLWNF